MPIPAVKPPKSTPAQRKAERQNREPNPYKPTYPKRKRIGEQETHVKARPQDHPDYHVNGSTIRTVSKKKLAELEAGGKRISSTFRQKPGTKRLERVRKVAGKVVKALTQRTGLNPSGKPLRSIGKRGIRMQPGDRIQEAKAHILPCCCGCNAHLRPGADGVPGKGLISRAHLESRQFEATRNDDTNNIPACLQLNYWLDFERGGATAKDELLTLAQKVDRRLTPDEVEPILSQNGYYSWLADRRIQER